MDWGQVILTIGISVVTQSLLVGRQIVDFRVALEKRLATLETKVDSFLGR